MKQKTLFHRNKCHGWRDEEMFRLSKKSMLGYVRLECEELVHASKLVCRSTIVNINRTISFPLNLLQKYVK